MCVIIYFVENVIAPTSLKRETAFTKRVHEIDFLRGLLILIVLMDHIFNAIYMHSASWKTWFPTNPTFSAIFNAMDFYWNWTARQIFRYFCLFLFCFVSGISCQFSRNNWKRAGEMIVVWALISVGSRLLQGYGIAGTQGIVIDFNIIGVLAFSTLFYCFVQNCSYKGILAAGLSWLFIGGYLLPMLLAIPGAQKFYNPALFEGLGYPTVDAPIYGQADWMPLYPYIFFFFAGALFSYFYYSDKKSKIKRFNWEKPICFVGRHTLIIYLAHQAVLIPVFALVDVIIKACCNG